MKLLRSYYARKNLVPSLPLTMYAVLAVCEPIGTETLEVCGVHVDTERVTEIFRARSTGEPRYF